MPQFRYRALDTAGKEIAGTLDAADSRAVVLRLHEDGLIPIETRPARGGRRDGGGRGAVVGRGAVTEVTRELAILLEAGHTVELALRLLAETAGQTALRALLAAARDRVLAGASLAEALAEHPQLFDGAYVATVRAGEATGRLVPVLRDLALARERRDALARRVTTAMIYPSILILASLGAVVLLLAVVVPSFTPLIAPAGERIPALARAVFSGAGWLQRHASLLLVVALAALALALLLPRLEPVALARDRLLLRLPPFAGVARDRLAADLARALATLLDGGLPVPDALALARDALSNRAARGRLERVAREVREGRPLARALEAAAILPPTALRMIAVGEESGRLREVVRHVADTYEERTAARLTRLVGLIEPVSVLITGVVVGGIVLAVLTAVMGVYELGR